jgi:hypothetical protein
MRSTVDIKNPHTVNKKGESWRRVRAGGWREVLPPLAAESRGCKIILYTKNFDFQHSTNFKLLTQTKGYSMSNYIYFVQVCNFS